MKKLIALFLASVLFLTACGTKVPEETAPTIALLPELESETVETPTESGLSTQGSTFGLSYMPTYGLNPYTCVATINRALFSLMYESLFVVTHDFTASPVLCSTFDSSSDGTYYRFRLLENAKFSDGTPLTAEDVKASLFAAKQSSMYAERLEHISSIYIPEDGSLEITLNTPYENFALMLDVPIVKASTVEADKPIGTGPYCFRGQSLARNVHWWKEDHGVLTSDFISLSVAHESLDLRSQFEFGSTDLIYCDPNSTAAAGYRCDYEVWEAPTTILHYLGFNLYSGWFIEESFRSAVTFAIDRDTFVNEIYGGFAQATPLPCSPSSPYHDDQLAEDYDYAPAKFKEALDHSGILTNPEYDGHEGRFLVCIDDPSRVKLAERICKVFTDAGLRISVTALERSKYEDALREQEFDVYLGEVRLTTNFDLSEFFMKYGNLQFGSINNTGMVTLCSEAIANSGSYSELHRQVLQWAPICPIVFKSYAIYVTRGKITNNEPGIDLVFHDGLQARKLADAYKTQEAP
ncbi:MAG: ABC transporter substrate-binding protein [Oscillospiraceae bacterium]|nr:ABC transporter substrate-binding protein [Oscillospiraceae bacterium]